MMKIYNTHDMTETEKVKKSDGRYVYKRPWIRAIAFLLAVIMVFSIWASSAVQVKIQPKNQQDAAGQYLVDNTGFVQSDDFGRLEEKVQSYFAPRTLEDYYRLAGTQIGAGEYAAALDSIEHCIELYSGGDDVLYIDLLLKKGCLQVLIGQYEQAVATLEQVLLEDPEQADAYLVLAQIYSELGNYQGLIPVLGEYLKLKPDDGDIRAVLAQVFFETGEYELAIAEYELLRQQEQMAENDGQILFLEALAYIQMADYSKAKDILVSLDQRGEAFVGKDYYLGVCYLSQEDYKNGEKYFTASLDAGEMTQLSNYSRAVCRLMKADFDLNGAISDLESAIAYEGADKDEAIIQQAHGLLDTIREAS